MIDFLQTREAQLVIWTAGFAALLVVGFYIVAAVRRSIRTQKGIPTAGEMMSNFRDLYSQGALSDEEFQTIKATLSQQLQQQLKEMKSKGINPTGDLPLK